MLKTIIVRKNEKDIIYADKNNQSTDTLKSGRHFYLTKEQMKSVASSTGKKIKGSKK